MTHVLMSRADQPYGNVRYADNGLQPDGKARYPLDTEDHIRAAWSYINQEDSASHYTPKQLRMVRARIKSAMRRIGADVADGQQPMRARLAEQGLWIARADQQTYNRSYALDNIEIVSRAKGGDGRTVEAYAAMFNKPYEVQDLHGHYNEVIAPGAFDQTLTRGAGRNAMCLYNHGMSLDGRPDSMAQIPIGTPLDIRADGRGLMTVTRYDMSEYADRILEAIRNGSIRSQSFRGRIIRSSPNGPIPGRRQGRPLPTITRNELGLSDYGPTPIPVNPDAEILAVRSKQELIHDLAALDDDDRIELLRSLGLDVVLDGDDDEEDEEDEEDEAFEDDEGNEEDLDDEENDDTSTSAQSEAGSEEPPTRALRSASDLARRIRVEQIRRGIA